MNGKGYDLNGNLKYEFIKGNGYIYEYDYNGYLIFEGTYLNGKRNGKRQEYCLNGMVSFVGEYLNGKGKEYN